MNRTELVLAMSATLFAAFVLGWLLRWAFGRLNQVNSVDVAEIDHLATRLNDAEMQLAETSNALVQKEAELEAAMEGLGMARREAGEFQDQLEALQASLAQQVAPDPVAAPDDAVETDTAEDDTAAKTPAKKSTKRASKKS